MDELKQELKREARRHSNKLIKKLLEIIEIPKIAQDSIHQEVDYAVLDGYRLTMKQNRNGDHEYDRQEEVSGNK